MIYLDHAATSPLLQSARREFFRVSEALWGNPNSVHSFGMSAARALESAQNAFAVCLSCDPEQVIFTSSATESCRLATQALWRRSEKFTISPYEHKAVHDAFFSMRNFFCVRTVPDAVSRSLAHIHTNNETGAVYDLSAASDGFDRFFSDCTAAMGKTRIDFRSESFDFIAGAGHKIGAPVGIGVLIAKHPEEIQFFHHPGTPSVPLASAFAQALYFRTKHLEEFSEIAGILHDRLIDGVLEEIPDAQLNGTKWKENKATQSPYIANISFPGVENHALVLRLSADGVMASSGAACSSGDNAPSRVLIASGYSVQRARSAVRFSFDYRLDPGADEFYPTFGVNLERDKILVDSAVKTISKNVQELRKISPVRDA